MEKVTESQIDGAFHGWPGRGAFRLVNGQIWEQIEYKYSYHYAYRPKATVWSDGGSYYLEVEGMQDKVRVRKR
jgi:hypothetical protein